MSSWVGPDPFQVDVKPSRLWKLLSRVALDDVEPSWPKSLSSLFNLVLCRYEWTQVQVESRRQGPMSIWVDSGQFWAESIHIHVGPIHPEPRLSRHRVHVEPSWPRPRSSRVGLGSGQISLNRCRAESTNFYVKLSEPGLMSSWVSQNSYRDEFNLIDIIDLIYFKWIGKNPNKFD